MTFTNKLFKDERTMNEVQAKVNERMEAERIHGKIIKVNKNQGTGGYGFIITDAIPFEKIFFHWTSLNSSTKNFKELTGKEKVSFIPVKVHDDKGKNKWKAIKIDVLDSEPAPANVS